MWMTAFVLSRPSPPPPLTQTHHSTFSESQRSTSVNTHVRSARQQRYTLDPQWNMCILHTWSFQTDGKWGRKKRTKLELRGWREDAKERTEGENKDQNIKEEKGGRSSKTFWVIYSKDVLYIFMHYSVGLKWGIFHYFNGFTTSSGPSKTTNSWWISSYSLNYKHNISKCN